MGEGRLLTVWVEYLARHWQVVVTGLTLASLTADVLAKQGHPWGAFVVGVVNAGGWAVLLGTRAPFVRSITAFSIASYLATTAIGVLYLGEALTGRQAAGLVCGLVAVVLLS